MSMTRSSHRRLRRLPAVVVCLALYAWGSNYCVLAAADARTQMACMTVAKPAEARSCCHHATPAQKSPAQNTAKPSCCPDPVVSPAVPVLQDDSGVPTHEIVFAEALALAPPTATAWHGHRAPPEGRSPTRILGAPLPARAPPLA
jgi:hypothetical protein